MQISSRMLGALEKYDIWNEMTRQFEYVYHI